MTYVISALLIVVAIQAAAVVALLVRGRWMKCFAGGFAPMLALALLSACAEAAAPKRVLVVHSFARDFAPYNAVGNALRAELTQHLRQPVAFQEVSLDAELGGVPKDEHLFVEYLVGRTRVTPPDLVIAIANPAMLFCLRHRDQIFPDRPLLVTGLDRRRLDTVKLGASDQAVTLTLDFPAVARTILELRPGTDTLAIVVGTSPLEQFWGKVIERELAPLGDRLRVLQAGVLSLGQMRERVAALPPNSAVLYYMFAVGADGALHENELALAAIRESSSVPVFGVFNDQLGRGIVGGPLVDSRRMGSVTAELAARMLQNPGAPGDHVAIPPPPPTFDWRELEHWGIPESRLPPGAEVRFREPSLWEQHRMLILSGASIVLLQAALITALLFQRARRRSAEKEAAGLTGRLLTAHEDEHRRLARELHDDLTQRLARLAIDAGKLERSAGAGGVATEMRKDLVQLSEDVHALSYRLHPSVLDDLGLVEALRAECDRVERRGELRVEVDARDVPEVLPAEASLCLFRVAQEALNNAVRHAGASAVSVLLSPSGKGLQLAVSDNGIGFDPGGSRDRASLGLASMRERVRQVRGELDIESTPGRGTTVVAWVPA